MEEEIKTDGFHIHFYGDPSVGIFNATWRLDGGFIFESAEELEEFREKLREAYEVICPHPFEVITFEEEWDKFN